MLYYFFLKTTPEETLLKIEINDHVVEVKSGSSIAAVLALTEKPEHPWLMAFVSGHPRDLNQQLTEDCRLEPRSVTSVEGQRAFRRGGRLLLIRAVAELYPELTVYIDHSLSGGFYGELRRNGVVETITPDIVENLRKRMAELVVADEEIHCELISKEAALAEFEKRGDTDKVKVLRHYPPAEIYIHRYGQIVESFYGPVAPRAGLLRPFGLVFYPPGFVLRFPNAKNPDELTPFVEQRKLFQVFHEYEDWIRVLGIETSGGLNRLIAGEEPEKVTPSIVSNGRVHELVLLAESLHEKKIAAIADDICSRHRPPRMILVAGPSSSGKTTFTHRLALQLTTNGMRPVPISVDDYFLPRGQTPLDVDGKPDFEQLNALDVEALNRDLLALLRGESVYLRKFDFKTGTFTIREQPLTITPETPLIVEGIHALNDEMTPQIPAPEKFKIYVSALTQLNLDNHNRLPTTDSRLFRRMIRDTRYRGYDALATLRHWPMVRRGEDHYIFPFQETADAMFNSSLIYEMAVLGKHARPLLEAVPETEPEIITARRMLTFLDFFGEIADELVPSNSLLREFIGGSVFR